MALGDRLATESLSDLTREAMAILARKRPGSPPPEEPWLPIRVRRLRQARNQTLLLALGDGAVQPGRPSAAPRGRADAGAKDRANSPRNRCLTRMPWLPLSEALRVACAIARGLYKAHRHGIIHRDLKPENVMVGEDDQVKLLDFGLAKAIDRDLDPELSSIHSATGMNSVDGRVVGTPMYMSPEQAKGGRLDARTDVFSFGVVLYEMLTGKRPFAGLGTVELFAAIDRDTPEPPSQVNPEVLPALEQLVLRCLHKDPGARYADAGAILDDLDPPQEDLSHGDTLRMRLRSFDTMTGPLSRTRRRPRPRTTAPSRAGGAACSRSWPPPGSPPRPSCSTGRRRR
jgi:serine/threonine protein kinase